MDNVRIWFIESSPPRWLQHSIWGWLRLRPPVAQHTRREHAALQKWAKGQRIIVELGVAEGVSALALRAVMHPEGTLYLIDPFHLSRWPWFNSMRRLARRTVSRVPRGRVVWIESFSFQAARTWYQPIDFLFIDADHRYESVRRDWQDWHVPVRAGGFVALHDARVFPGGWITPHDGPVRLAQEILQCTSDWQIVDEVDSLVIMQRMP